MAKGSCITFHAVTFIIIIGILLGSCVPRGVLGAPFSQKEKAYLPLFSQLTPFSFANCLALFFSCHNTFIQLVCHHHRVIVLMLFNQLKSTRFYCTKLNEQQPKEEIVQFTIIYCVTSSLNDKYFLAFV